MKIHYFCGIVDLAVGLTSADTCDTCYAACRICCQIAGI